MAAIGDAAAQDLITRAAKVGITREQIAVELRTRPEWLDGISGASLRRADQMIERATAAQAAAARRAELLDQIEHIAGLLGYDGAAKRAAADKKFRRTSELADFVRQCAEQARRDGHNPRTPAQQEKDATAAHRRATEPVTDRQVDYLVKLLARRTTSGEGGGFATTTGLYTADGNIDVNAVRALTKSAASNLIDSLTNRY
ncbi:hypothetical protein AB0C34_17065 [Nocardia sp. NPDC049220]|uniref:hypothetical protein n=1 Tax=Nocardia sp. NPDC049220 TaxID=3155273 RepID=UPI0033E74580